MPMIMPPKEILKNVKCHNNSVYLVGEAKLPMYVTYSDLIQIGIFICALVGLCYTIFKGKRK